MKKIFSITVMLICTAVSLQSFAQGSDKSKRPSPPAKVKQLIKGGATISIEYSQPSVKGRTIGKDLEPLDNKVWRTGANEATVFETDKNITINGQKLPAGKYGLFTLFNGNDCTVIFNKTWNQWGAFTYKEADDALRIKAKSSHVDKSTEMMTFTISPSGEVKLLWGTLQVTFTIK
ncbi:MAG TPA: DUF2911 domain-containing protein [Chitinophagaceae bacterium]